MGNTLSNKLVLLLLADLSSQEGWLGITKLQKLAFLLEYTLFEKGKRAMDYEFFMYDLGPMSVGVYSDFEFLLEGEFLREDETGIKATSLGKRVSREVNYHIPKDISETMKRIVLECAQKSTAELVENVHKMRIRLPDGTRSVVERIRRASIILPKPVSTCLDLSSQYAETLSILSDRTLRENIRRSRETKSRSETYKPLSSSSS